MQTETEKSYYGERITPAHCGSELYLHRVMRNTNPVIRVELSDV